VIKEQIAYQLLLNKRSGRSFTHESDLGVSKTTAQKLILGGIIKWHEGDYYSVTQEAASWVQRKHPHDMMLTPRRGTT
jgi:hypothetical protein